MLVMLLVNGAEIVMSRQKRLLPHLLMSRANMMPMALIFTF